MSRSTGRQKNSEGPSSRRQPKVDKVRASRDGHAYHEAWAARSALELLPPTTSLAAIALEGFAREDEAGLSNEAAEVADTVLYYGAADVGRANLVEIVQFKYSIARKSEPVRAADLAKTLRKFAGAETDLRAKHGAHHVERVVRYRFATNRPIHGGLAAALDALRSGEQPTDEAADQAAQVTKALGRKVGDLREFVRRLEIAGSGGMLAEVNWSAGHVLANWSVPSDAQSKVRLLNLRRLVRDKAGIAGQGDNLITRLDVLVELDVHDERDLYPTEAAFPPVVHVVDRPIVGEIAQAARNSSRPIIVHAAGGMGKTVVMQSVADTLSPYGCVLLFDGFGGGRWRDPADGRHRPDRTFVHLANLLAGQGLCDVLLPATDDELLLRALRTRLQDGVMAVRQSSPEGGVFIILDAIDHAALAASATKGRSFAHLLLASLSVEPIAGVSVVASCRTERLEIAVGGADHQPIEVPPFNAAEVAHLVQLRDPAASSTEVAALDGRSGRNPRCLDALIAAGRPYEGPRPGGPNAEGDAILDALLSARVVEARASAVARGASVVDVDLWLAGLSMLPPPVPAAELASAQGVTPAEVESFAADLAPLVERTPHGLMFRDEPTETYVRRAAGRDAQSRERVVANLVRAQETSDYAARALPYVLTELGQVDQLIELAFDSRLPRGTSQVAKRQVRLARVVAALAASARARRYNDLFRLLLEASLVAAGHSRTDRFLYEHPDLAAIGGDAEALRRLFETKTGWQGGRHSSLAIANILSGDEGEARRNAARAIEWYNWAVARERPIQMSRSKAEWNDELGFGYVEALTGNDVRIARWLGRRDEEDAYDRYLGLFHLLERHAALDEAARKRMMRVFSRASRCRLPSRALYAAALRYSRGDGDQDRRLLLRLAAAPTPEGRGRLPANALLLPAVRALAIGMVKEATSLMAKVDYRPRLHHFTSEWPLDDMVPRAIIGAGVSAAIGGRPAVLFDIAPSEFLALIPPGVRRRGERASNAILTERLSSDWRPRRRSRGKANDYTANGERDTRKQALQHRILPLLTYATHISHLIRPPVGTTVSAVLNEALSAIEAATAEASEYPYRDAKRYIAKSTFLALFEVSDTLGVVDGPSAMRMAKWLNEVPHFNSVDLTDIVDRLSRREETHDAALLVAARVHELIRKDTEIDARISAYGALARAVSRISADEAAVYFRVGLDLADAVGSDDYDRVSALLAVTAKYEGDVLSPRAGHALARIFDLNQYDERKFPWTEYGRAMSRVAGVRSLAIAARLEDRRRSGLEYTLAPLLTALVDTKALAPDLAACLFGLAEISESWDWGYSSFVGPALADLPAGKREWLFDLILAEIDQGGEAGLYSTGWARLLKLAKENLPAESAALARLEVLARRHPESEAGHDAPAHPEDDGGKLAAVDLTDTNSIDDAIEVDARGEERGRWPARTIRRLAAHATARNRTRFVQAVARAQSATLGEKVHGLEDVLRDWTSTSPALRDLLPSLALEVATLHASEIVANGWEAGAGWRLLIGQFHGEPAALVSAVVAALGPKAGDVGGEAWLLLASRLAPAVDAPAQSAGLNRYLAKLAETLPEEAGDGPWSDRFLAADDQVEATAGLIWACLGHAAAAVRWRAAHAIRRLAAIDRGDVIDKIVARYDALDAGAFGSPVLPFYPMHARLWLLAALSCIARDKPATALPHQMLLERVAFDKGFPHVAMQAQAAAALGYLTAVLSPEEGARLRARLETVNVSPFPPTAPSRRRGQFANRPDEAPPEPTDAFHLEYDFNKYEVTGLGEIFGCDDWQISDAITRWVRRWDPTVRAMYDCPRLSSGRYDVGGWSGGSVPKIDRYGGYLGWHALMLAAGELLAVRPMVKHEWRESPWGDFLTEAGLTRRDGIWLADATDRSPLDLPTSISMPDMDRRLPAKADALVLAPLVGLGSDGSLGTTLCVTGSFNLPDEVNIQVRSLLVDPAIVGPLASALLTAEPFFCYLPDLHEAHSLDPDEITERPAAWTQQVDVDRFGLDRHDPYAAPDAAKRGAPADWLVAEEALTLADPIGRQWQSGQDTVLWSEAWGFEEESRRERRSVGGVRLVVDARWLQRLLSKRRRALVGLVKAQKYISDKSARRGKDGAFTHRVLFFSLGTDGHVRFHTSIPGAARDVVKRLDNYGRSDLTTRYAAIAPLFS